MLEIRSYMLTSIRLYQFLEKSLKCHNPLGMVNGTIAEGPISISTECDGDNVANQDKLNFTTIVTEARAWTAATTDAEQWLQVDLGTEYSIARVTRVKTQGRRGFYSQWVTKYKLQFSLDGGKTVQYYRDQGQTTDKVKYKHSYY